MPFSLRLDPDTEARIRRLAAATGQTRSWVVREAVARYDAEGADPLRTRSSALERLAPFAGRIRSGGRRLSERTHEKFREALRRKARARRSR